MGQVSKKDQAKSQKRSVNGLKKFNGDQFGPVVPDVTRHAFLCPTRYSTGNNDSISLCGCA